MQELRVRSEPLFNMRIDRIEMTNGGVGYVAQFHDGIKVAVEFDRQRGFNIDLFAAEAIDHWQRKKQELGER